MELNDEEQYISSYNSSNILSNLDRKNIENHFNTIKSHVKKELNSINIEFDENQLNKEIINLIISEYLSKKI